MSKRASPTLIGAFVVGSAILAVVAAGVFGSGQMFRTTYPYVLYFTGDVNGLKVGAPVKFKGVEVGAVRDVLISVSDLTLLGGRSVLAPDEFRIPVVIELDQEALTQKGGDLTPNPQTIRQLIEYGLRGQLMMESFVTGLLYVKLDLAPETPVELVADPTVEFVEIPTLPTPLEEVQMKAAEFFARLEEIDLAGLIDGLAEVTRGINALVSAPALGETLETLPAIARNLDQAIVQLSTTLSDVGELSKDFDDAIAPVSDSIERTANDAGATLRAATSTLERANETLHPTSPLMFQLGRTLSDLAEASRAIRRFAEDLERNPSVIVRGKAVEEETK